MLRFCLDPPQTMPLKAVGCPFGHQIFKKVAASWRFLVPSSEFLHVSCSIVGGVFDPLEALMPLLGARSCPAAGVILDMQA